MHWSELTRLVQASASLADPDVRVQFVVDKVAALLAEQDEGRGLPAIQEDDDVPEHAAALFRASFPALAAADPPERLISYYYGSLHTSAVPIKCTLFAGVSSLALLFAPAGLRDPVSIAWTDITSITKQSVLLLLDNAIRIVVSDGRQFVFVTVRRDDCYALLDQLWNNQIALLHKSAATRQLATRRSPELVADADDNADTSAAGDNAALTRHALDRVRLHDNQRRSLHIPPDEKVIYSFQCQLFVPPPKPGNVLGTCLVTSNALCFLSERTREISLVLPFTRITAIEETSSFIGIINTGFTVKTHLAAFKFSAFTRGEHLKQVHGQMALHANKRASLPPPLAPGDPGVLIDRFGRRRWTATADGGGDLEFQAQQHQLEVLWAQYFVSNGVSSDLCVLRRKLELLDLARRGCPNELRANVWSVLSGAAFLSEREPGLFQRLLAERGNEQTKAAREIATDLNRSSNHPFFSRNPEAHESLRRVLVTFSLRNTTIGYCVPEEHEILTNRGFLDLDAYEAAAAADPTLLVASYNVAAKALVFERPNKLVQFADATRELVELSDADEMMHVWSADSDSHGLAQCGQSNGVSMLVTKEHDVFAQLGNASVDENGTHAKHKAGDLLKSDPNVQQRPSAGGRRGRRAVETVPDFCDELGLRTPSSARCSTRSMASGCATARCVGTVGSRSLSSRFRKSTRPTTLGWKRR
jgi:hypothetical protein